MTEEVDKDSLSFILTLSLQNKQIKLKKKTTTLDMLKQIC